MIKINNELILNRSDFSRLFDITAMLPAARKIALDPKLFGPAEKPLQQILLSVTDGEQAVVENGTICAAGCKAELVWARGCKEGRLSMREATRILLFELAGHPYSVIGQEISETVHNPELPDVIEIMAEQFLMLPAESEADSTPRWPLRPVTVMNRSHTGHATVTRADGSEVVRVAPRSAVVLLAFGDTFASLVPGSIALSPSGMLCLPGAARHEFEPGRLTQVVPDQEGGFTALIDGVPTSYSVCVSPSDIEDIYLRPETDGPVVMMATLGSHIVALTASGRTRSNIPCPQSDLTDTVRVWTENYSIRTQGV